MLSGKIKPLYNEEILDEYFDVLNRSKFHLSEIRIHELLNFFKQYGIDSSRFPYDGTMPDEDDRVFYEVCLSKEDSFLVTGNLKHEKPVDDNIDYFMRKYWQNGCSIRSW